MVPRTLPEHGASGDQNPKLSKEKGKPLTPAASGVAGPRLTDSMGPVPRSLTAPVSFVPRWASFPRWTPTAVNLHL